MATNRDCTRLASVAYDGSLIVYDMADGRVAFKRMHAHEGQITSVAFQNNDIFTAGIDASVKQWQVSEQLVLSADARMSGPVNRFHKLRDGWVASISERMLVMHSTTSQSDLKLTLGRAIADIATSPDERYVAVADLSEILVIDRQRDMIATTHISAGDIGCLQFITSTKLVACDTAAILSVSIDRLNFTTMSPQE